MLGLFSSSDRPPAELSEFAVMRELAPDDEPTVRGPLTVAVPASARMTRSEQAGVTCVLDGVIYDREALARSLGAEPQADAHLVARAYRRSGSEAFRQLRGRYAAAVWDEEARAGVLVCDLLAAQELFFARTAQATVFATELRDLLGMLPTQPGPDPLGFGSWLGEGMCPPDRTLYAGVHRLRAGELLALGGHTADRRRYWRPRLQPPASGTRAQLAEELRAQLAHAVRKRLSPSRSAVILSGGLDSSVVSAVAAAAAPAGATVRTYSAVFPGEDYDESWKIRTVNEHIGIAPGAIEIAPQGILWLALRHTGQWKVPLIAAGSVIDIAATAEAARDGADVVLDGQTGDELFGLSPYLIADRIRRGRVLAAIALADQWPLGRRTTVRNKIWLIRELGLKGAAPHRLGRLVQGRRDRSALGPRWLAPELRRQFAEREDRWAWKLGASGPLWWRFLSDVLVEAPHRELRLEYLRHRAGTEGIVAEPPLYDVDLIEFCLRLPPELAYDRRFDRPLVREAMRDLLPDEVRLQTRKADFTRFCERAMVTADAPGIARLLTASDALIGEYADLEWVRASWSRIAAGEHRPEWLAALWRLVAAEVWLQAQADPGFLEATAMRRDVLPPAVRRVTLGGGKY